jgi:aminoglycoside/choline kinase family phosphotransferase
VRVPSLLDDAPGLGAALVEDLGDVDLAVQIRGTSAQGRALFVEEAERLLEALRAVDPAAARLNPPFDSPFFESELLHTRTWLLEKGGESPLPDAAAREWDDRAGLLARAAAGESGEPVPTHRDFHANNLLRTADGALAAIDFQDLRLGPPDYDPVSLRFERAGALVGASGKEFAPAVLLQRAWKVLGTFEKMLAKGREIYRPHRDTAVAVIRRHTDARGPFGALLRFLPPG